jgi:phage tail tape-measure protein
MLEAEKPGKNRIGSELALALFYCVEKSDRGLAMMESLLPRVNELIEAAAKLDGFDTHYLRDGEWNMSADGNLGELLTFLAENAAYYAWCDFDRAVKLAAQFERAEIRMMAQVKLAQSILAGPPKAFRIRLSR